ncbi:hypothetical protein GCM10020367_24730 [Streptomyces sannanensis]|uniref:ATP-grasp domain-containing protein n=1 Tax=Streptomyces sannanensis TaxID=285536 RepID=A0ABP6SA44_9ACTN
MTSEPLSVAYVTSRQVPDDEADLVTSALARQGVESDVVVWDDPAVAWERYGLVLVRSVWDYTDRRAEFLDWARRVDGLGLLRNPAAVLERNTDKTYLRELAAHGVPIVPTHWVGPGEELAPEAAPWPELVVKPTVSAGARDTIRTADRAVAAAHVKALTSAGRTAMVQPYLPMVEDEGEISLLFLGGEFSHAVRRAPQLVADRKEHGDVTVRRPEADQLALAERVLAAIPERGELLYARVDLVRSPEGEPLLIELELTEPYLYLRQHEGAADLLAAAVRARLTASGGATA